MWFDLLDNLSRERIFELQRTLRNHTLVGTYLAKEHDNQFFYYEKNQLMFSAIVKNDGQRIAILPE